MDTWLKTHLRDMEHKRSSTLIYAPSKFTKYNTARKQLDFATVSNNLMKIGEKPNNTPLSPIMTLDTYEELLRDAKQSPTLQMSPDECDEILKHFSYNQNAKLDPLATLCQEIGIENTDNKENEENTDNTENEENTAYIDVVESSEDLHQVPMEINAFELPLNFSQAKRLKLAVDIRTQVL